MQMIIVGIVILGAVAYALWRVYGTMKTGGWHCSGCRMANVCKKNKNSARFHRNRK